MPKGKLEMLAAQTILTGAHGRYRVLGEHGRGGFGITYRAQRETDGLPVIIKALRLERLTGWKAFELFERETAVLKALAHPGVPRWVDEAALGDRSAPRGFALVMEFVPGRTLLEIASAGGGLAPGQMLDWFADILEVLAFIHGRSPPVIHRDVTPKNIILRPDGRAALVDFGCVQAALRAAEAPSSTAAGTFGFAPPEQFVGRAEPSCDLHGLAMTFLAIASGHQPEDMPRDGLRVNVGRLLSVDPHLVRLLAAMTEPDPRYRLGSAEEALQLLLPIRRNVAERPSLTAPPITIERSSISVDTFFSGLIERLKAAGFEIEDPGEIGRTPLAVAASRPGSMTDAAMYLYAARAELLEGGSAGRPLSPVATALFVQAAAGAARPSGGFVGALLGHQAVVAPVLVTAAGCERRTAGHLLATIREPTNVIVVPAIVDLGTGTVELVGSRSLLPGDPANVRARLRALLAGDEFPLDPSW